LTRDDWRLGWWWWVGMPWEFAGHRRERGWECCGAGGACLDTQRVGPLMFWMFTRH